MSKKLLAWVFLFVLSLTASLQAKINLLHSFAGATDGEYPQGSLMAIGSTLYGMTAWGGSGGGGTIFKIKTDGTGFALLHSFAGAAADGADPAGSLIAIGSTLYGMTSDGGTNDLGTIFRIKTNGTGFALLHSFAGAAGGEWPNGSLIAIGSTLYGMTEEGGTYDYGTIFEIKTDGTGFALLHSFQGGATDGIYPFGSLKAIGSTLYGMTSEGGTDDLGTIFEIKTDGTGFALLHSFTGATDGYYPLESLIAKGSTLYGMAMWGGTNNLGTIFKIKTSGTGFALLHSFAGAADGECPMGSLIAMGSILYGMTERGSTDSYGTIFKIKTNGTGFKLLHSFAAGSADGAYPFGSLKAIGSTLYGMTQYGGASDYGVIFSYRLK